MEKIRSREKRKIEGILEDETLVILSYWEDNLSLIFKISISILLFLIIKILMKINAVYALTSLPTSVPFHRC